MAQSNINITPNIYIRKQDIISDDVEYARHITGMNRLKELRNRLDGTSLVQLTGIQQKILDESQKCYYAQNGEVSFGPVRKNGELVWSCRCENKSCVYYDMFCTTSENACVIERTEQPPERKEQSEDIEKFFHQLGIQLHENTLEFPETKYILPEETTVNDYQQAEEPVISQTSDFIHISEPSAIIHASLDSHILLNSGPGTGKTYTIIERLIYILEHQLCPAEEIYVLCYTRSAKKVIDDKVDKAVSEGRISPSAKNIHILTFDSYAAYFLLYMKEEIKENFSSYDYNQRISLFNQYISKDDFEAVSYFIVDEIQDLVNERAEMVLNILKYLKCGYLLAGDRCQSIYDYEADKDATLDSVRFYQLVEALFPSDIIRYEITINRRQDKALAETAEEMRNILLSGSIQEQNTYAKSVMKQFSQNIRIERYIRTLQNPPSVPTAILCRNNGETEYISGLLCKQKISHKLNRGVNQTRFLPRWIADVFWDYCQDTISRNAFSERVSFRCDSSRNPEQLWEALCQITGTNPDDQLSVRKMLFFLPVINNLPEVFFDPEPTLTVSTIHKAKGSEFDRVILVDSQLNPKPDSAEEARIRYVALTRPKNALYIMQKNKVYFRHTTSGRIIRKGIHNLYQRQKCFCSHIVLGLDGDTDNNSFVAGSFEEAVSVQEYLSTQVKQYDELKIQRATDTRNYELLHNGHVIGTLSKAMLKEFAYGIEATDYKYRLPDILTDLYVSNITTEILKQSDDCVPEEFQKSRICYGIQITGLAKLHFDKGNQS